ncbi:MAG TPA: sensor domain-containing diguanylate cyclase [Sphingomonadaceae bacterium]|nr:sensor domain-containing diguanylate cyclase [Sphingomonadaceae bacterium]
MGKIREHAGLLAIAAVWLAASAGMAALREHFSVMALLWLAAAVPLALYLVARERLARKLGASNAKMRESLLMLEMAEEVARIGRWKFDPRNGKQDWSRQMYRINGLDPGQGSDPGDIRFLLPDRGRALFGELSNHAADRAPFSFEYPIVTPSGERRVLKMHAQNEFDEKGDRVAMFGVVMDITEHRLRQEQLDKERDRAMRLAAEARYLAQTDPLTGLANRRRTIEQLEKCILRCALGDQSLALITFDVDHFKQVNDRHGHQVGDEVLVKVAELALEQARASDLVGRTGGEEFVWLLPEAGAIEASLAAERLRRAVERESGGPGLPPVTLSIGYALWQPGDNSASLLGRADAALYAAKQGGRNLVREAA